MWIYLVCCVLVVFGFAHCFLADYCLYEEDRAVNIKSLGLRQNGVLGIYLGRNFIVSVLQACHCVYRMCMNALWGAAPESEKCHRGVTWGIVR